MGQFKNIFVELQNYFPEEDDYDKLFHEFYEWLNESDMFVPSNKIGIYLDLCNNEQIAIDQVCAWWCRHIKLNIHNGEGFVINQ